MRRRRDRQEERGNEKRISRKRKQEKEKEKTVTKKERDKQDERGIRIMRRKIQMGRKIEKDKERV